MENRSFDHYLGWLPGADGRQAGLEYTDPAGHTFATHRLRTDFLDAYQELVLSQPESGVNQALKEAFLALRKATQAAE